MRIPTGFLDLRRIASVTSPPAGFARLFSKNGTNLFIEDENGTETQIGSSGAADIRKVVTATQSVTTTAGSAITDFTQSLAPGTYRITGCLVLRSSAATTGYVVFPNAVGGTVTRCVGQLTATTTGTTATSGVVDGATVSTVFQTVEGRAWRANNASPGPFGGVDSANSDTIAIIDCIIVVTATTSLTWVLASEVAASGVSVEPGSTLKIEVY